MYRYTQTWFYSSELKREISKHLDGEKEINILEIGTFEGLSTTYFGDNFLNHSQSTLDAIDPFLHIDDNDHTKYLNGVEQKYDYNISVCKNKDKITTHKMTSDKFFKNFKGDKMYDFIYVDGCHLCDAIYKDMENSFNKLKDNGIMWLDDYLGGANGNDDIKKTMDKFVELYKDNIKIIHSGYQLAFVKTT